MRALLCALVVVVLLPEPARAAIDRHETLAVGGTSHGLHYDAAIAPRRRAALKDALRRGLEAYAPLFGVPNLEVHVFFENRPAADASLMAQAGFIATTTPGKLGCNLTVYRHRELRAEAALKFTVAHELVHCFMHASRSDLRTVTATLSAATDDNAWWVEGAAEYLASTLYRPAGARITTTLVEFSSIVPDPIFGKDYEQFWFFQYLGTSRGVGAVVDLIKRIPATRADQITWLSRPPLGSAEVLFRDYAKAVAGRRLPRQPATPVADVPRFGTTVSLMTQAWSVAPRSFRLPSPRPDWGVRVSITRNGDPPSYRLVTGSDDITGGYSSCGGAAPRVLALAVSRAAISAGTDEAELKITIDEVMCTPRITQASLAGTYLGRSNGTFVPALVERRAFPEDREPFVLIDHSLRPNTFTLDAAGALTGQGSGEQRHARGFVSFRGSGVTGRIVLGRQVRAEFNSALFAATVELAGVASGQAGVLEADGVTYRFEAGSRPMRFPTLTQVECTDITVVDGAARCGALILLEGDRPRFELSRTP